MKRLLYLFLALVAIVLAAFFMANESLPKGESGPEAEALADKMLAAVNIHGWDSIAIVKWTFRGSHHYIWDKHQDLVQVTWGSNVVLLNTQDQTGTVWSNKTIVDVPEQHSELLQTAWAYFANDSFWFSAPFKIRDPGTERRIVKTEAGSALLVTYTSGGVTPGDSYLWFVDDNGIPMSWKMWVDILPVGGLQFSWEDWNTYDFNTKIASMHSGIITVPISNLETMSSRELSNGVNPFNK